MPEPLRAGCDVSRETAALERYVALLLRWNARINLIGRGSEADVWRRHIADSAQLCELGPRAGHWLDLGSGGGLPAAVVATLALHRGMPLAVTCIESDRRKCAFLRTAARELGLPMTVRAERIEAAPPLAANVVSARALAPLTALLGYAAPHLLDEGICLFPKGKSWRSELEAARRSWHFSCEAFPSATAPDAVILRIGDLARA